MLHTFFVTMGYLASAYTGSFIAISTLVYLAGIGIMYGFDEAAGSFDSETHVVTALLWPLRATYLVGKVAFALVWWFCVKGFMISMIGVGYRSGMVVTGALQRIEKRAAANLQTIEHWDRRRARYVTVRESWLKQGIKR